MQLELIDGTDTNQSLTPVLREPQAELDASVQQHLAAAQDSTTKAIQAAELAGYGSEILNMMLETRQSLGACLKAAS